MNNPQNEVPQPPSAETVFTQMAEECLDGIQNLQIQPTEHNVSIVHTAIVRIKQMYAIFCQMNEENTNLKAENAALKGAAEEQIDAASETMKAATASSSAEDASNVVELASAPAKATKSTNGGAKNGRTGKRG